MKEEILTRIKEYQKFLAFYEKHESWILENGLEVSECNYKLDFDRPDREKVVLIQLHFGGKWEKEYSGQVLNYIQVVEGTTVRIYGAALPPSCKLVERTRIIEETVTPRHTEVYFEIECEKGEVVDANS